MGKCKQCSSPKPLEVVSYNLPCICRVFSVGASLLLSYRYGGVAGLDTQYKCSVNFVSRYGGISDG